MSLGKRGTDAQHLRAAAVRFRQDQIRGPTPDLEGRAYARTIPLVGSERVIYAGTVEDPESAGSGKGEVSDDDSAGGAGT
jgi:hypothetical protein